MKRSHSISVALISAGLLAACTPVGPGPGTMPDSGPAGPRLAEGSLSSAGESEARQLLETAREALQAGDSIGAEGLASRVVSRYPSSRVSLDALLLRHRIRAAPWRPDATLGAVTGGSAADSAATSADSLGAAVDPAGVLRDPPEAPVERDPSGALADGERLLGILPADDPRVGEVRLVHARVLAGSGNPEAALLEILALTPGDSLAILPEDSAWVKAAAGRVEGDVLADALTSTGPGTPLRLPLLVAYARGLRLSSDEDGARRFAQEALDAGVAGRDAEVARALVEGRSIPRADGTPVPVAVVLPLGGSPAFQVFARELQEGVEAAVEAWDLSQDVELMVMDDGGDVQTAANLVRAAEARGAVAVLGLLDDASLEAAGQARVAVPLISPTAYEVPDGETSILSLNAFDPGAAEALASWTAGSGIRQVAIIHASSGASAREAQLFSERFQEMGGSVLRTFPYPDGVTFWEPQIQGAVELMPEALVLAIPVEDVPGIAAQVTFFGVDTLGIRVMGTGGFTDPQILAEVEPRHTDGVVVATPVRQSPESEAYTRFREAYERRFQRALRDGAVQALGYDAASLVLRGVYAGAGQVPEMDAAVAQVTDFQGATGILSVVDGELRRQHQVVCIENREQIPVRAGQLPVQQYRPYPPDPETEEVPEGPGRPDGFACPQVMDRPLPGDSLSPGDTLRIPPDTFRIPSH